MRNFLLRAGMSSTLERFEAEWYEVCSCQESLSCAFSSVAPQLLEHGQLAVEASTLVPDAFARCEALEEAIRVRTPQPRQNTRQRNTARPRRLPSHASVRRCGRN